jgi:hypothetical protein
MSTTTQEGSPPGKLGEGFYPLSISDWILASSLDEFFSN